MCSLAAIFRTLRGRLVLLVCLATLPAIIFIFLAAAEERRSVLMRMETEARHLGRLASREHAHQLNGGRNLVQRLSEAVACSDDDATSLASCPDYLPALLSGFPQFANIGVADPRGDVRCSAAAIRQPANLLDNTAYQRAIGSDETEAGTYAMGFVGRPVLHLARAVRAPTRAVCAVVFVAVELGWLEDLARQANLSPDYALLITDRTGRVLARSGTAASELSVGSGAPPALTEVLDQPRGTVLQVGSPPTLRYFVATRMEGVPGIFVIAGLPYDRMQHAANRAFYRTLVGLVLVTIFTIFAALLAAELSVLRELRALTRAVRRFGSGDLSARAPLPGSHGELRELAVSFSNMAEALALRQVEAMEAQDQLRALSRRLQVVRDQEAGRIARELHDELGQVLTGLKIELSRMRRVHGGGAMHSAAEDSMRQMSEHIDGAIDTVRRISSELRPPVLDRLGLAAALSWLVQEQEAQTDVAMIFNVSSLQEPIESLVSTTLFRIVQEALTNVARHASATVVTIDLVEKDATLVLTIHDNGKGIEPEAIDGPESLGILGMRERIHLLGGSWSIHGEPGRGTTIVAQVPRQPPISAGPPAEKETKA
ncbi:MAG: HAMP domain-containing protein [Deltaproteobacteria bacterium]|nr:HAMP domain-containing protein [Deltaproteobacteria bacterium]